MRPVQFFWHNTVILIAWVNPLQKNLHESGAPARLSTGPQPCGVAPVEQSPPPLTATYPAGHVQLGASLQTAIVNVGGQPTPRGG